MALIELLKQYTFVRAPDTEVKSVVMAIKYTCVLIIITMAWFILSIQVPLQTVIGVTMSPKNGIYLKVVNRN